MSNQPQITSKWQIMGFVGHWKFPSNYWVLFSKLSAKPILFFMPRTQLPIMWANNHRSQANGKSWILLDTESLLQTTGFYFVSLQLSPYNSLCHKISHQMTASGMMQQAILAISFYSEKSPDQMYVHYLLVYSHRFKRMSSVMQLLWVNIYYWATNSPHHLASLVSNYVLTSPC